MAASGDSMDTQSASAENLSRLREGWFSEVNEQWPGVALSFKVDEVLWDQRSEYQHVQVFRTGAFGNVLVLDGVVQVTEKDEMAYQEMITHIPMFAHPNPEYGLIVGGGDGGVIREMLKHPSIKNVTICEIDQMVIDVSKRFLPSVASMWDDARVTLHRGDAAEYIKRPECIGKFDVIVSDTSDPVGPAEALFEAPFYQSLSNALKPGGIVATQAESYWLHLSLIQDLVRNARPFFAAVEYAYTQIPTYPLGQIGFLVCSKAQAADADGAAAGKRRRAASQKAKVVSAAVPVRSAAAVDPSALRYYSSELHAAAFVLPAFVTRAIAEAQAKATHDESKDTVSTAASSSSKVKESADSTSADSNAASAADPQLDDQPKKKRVAAAKRK